MSKINEKFDNALFPDDDIDLRYIDSDFVAFLSNDICFNSINLNNMVILTIKILQLLIMLNLWLSVTDITNRRHAKKG